jgi:Flp pilus assembly pilin Flp
MARGTDRGSASLEAGLLAAGIAALLVTALSLTGDEVQLMFQSWLDAVSASLSG